MAIKKINPKSVIRIVSLGDDAVDLDASPKFTHAQLGEQLKYAESLDERDLVFKEGKTPTFFLLKNLPSGEQASLFEDHVSFDLEKKRQNYKNMNTMLNQLFRTCCVSLEEDGKIQKFVTQEEFDRLEKDGKQEGYLSFDAIPYQMTQEIGGAVLTRATVGDPLKNV